MPSIEDDSRERFDTFPVFGFIGVRCTNNAHAEVQIKPGETQKPENFCNPLSPIMLEFSTPVMRREIKEHVGFDPSFAGKKADADPWGDLSEEDEQVTYAYRKDRAYNVYLPYGLKAAQRYSLTLPGRKPGLWDNLKSRIKTILGQSAPSTDVVRDQFGRWLPEAVTMNFTTDHRAPNVLLEYHAAVLEKNIDSEVPIYVNNINRIDLSYSQLTMAGPSKDLTHSVDIPHVEDLQFLMPLGVRDILGQQSGAMWASLATDPEIGGIQPAQVDGNSFVRTHHQIMRRFTPNMPQLFAEVTPFQVHLKLGHFNSLVWVTDLATGKPVSDADVVLYKDVLTDMSGPQKDASLSYQNRWNSFDYIPLHAMPDFLLQAFVLSEDRHFYEHHGIDWQALGGAFWQNLKSFSKVRGASTITEQVVRIVNERPRNVWSKWLEGWEAEMLDSHASKAEILEFYCNEVPYASNRRGIVQAAHYYFNRDLMTLTKKELLALVVLARAPSSYDLYRSPTKVEAAVLRLAQKLKSENLLDDAEFAEISQSPLQLGSPQLPVDASHFVNYVRNSETTESPRSDRPLRTTLDANLQRRVQEILGERLKSLAKLSVRNAAAVVVDQRTAEILAWVVVGGGESQTASGASDKIDAVTVPRQPGSALKPFLYTLALDRGWSPATILDDSPMEETIGSGLHEFKNYSHSFYGKISLREALGNSLNIPALRTIGFVGVDNYLKALHALGFASLTQDADVYKDGLALGNGEVTLYEMVQGYTALAHRGEFRPLRFDMDADHESSSTQIYSPEAASLIGNILSDPWARRLEFGYGSVLNLPIQTAVKTGTSTDYNDAWTMGFDSRYVVGIWMGNLDRQPMDGVTGAVGPALALHSIFAELHQDQETESLYLSPKLVQKEICLITDQENKSVDKECHHRSEYFIPGTETAAEEPDADHKIELTRPTQGLQMA
ncbi:MAG: transglycosylase domain-containing protein, partial [Alphaproteobacteria bacterium]